MENFIGKLIAILGVCLLIFILALILAFPTMWLWNWLMPAIFGITKITVFQAIGLNVLIRLLSVGVTSK